MPKCFCLFLGGGDFQPREFTRSGSKAKDGERLKVGNNNGQLRIANTTSGGASKAAWAKKKKQKSFLPNQQPPPKSIQ